MIVYLDQNKWIELARIFHGKDKSDNAKSILRDIEKSLACGYVYPLSSCHYIEFARIRNPGKRSRLGQVMWRYSGGRTLISLREIVEHEIEVGLQSYLPEIKPRKINLIGFGIAHAFGEKLETLLPEWFNSEIEKMLLTGARELELDSIQGISNKHRLIFKNHLETVQKTKREISRSKWVDWLHAITLIDILEPFNDVLLQHNLDPMSLSSIIAQNGKDMISRMPSRAMDIHLHHQVLKNHQYKPKVNDLEDWAGLGVAACYCDVVVCEKHFANMIIRDGFSVHARVETNLANIFKERN